MDMIRGYTIYDIEPKLAQHQSELEALKISQSILKKMHHVFKRIDRDKSGTIEQNELFAFLDLKKDRYSMRLFCMLDDDSSGNIDFEEFVLNLWNYCLSGKSTLGDIIVILF